MNRLIIQTPSRLHFGLLSWGVAEARQFGGVGLMVDEPGLRITAEPAATWAATGPLSARILAVAGRVASCIEEQGRTASPLRFEVEHAPPEHVGLGVGTQLGMAVARLISEFAAQSDVSPATLSGLSGRGLRSGIGLHGFALGGLLVDGGRSRLDQGSVAPLLARFEFPSDWSVLIVVPPHLTGLHGSPEVQAFAQLPPFPTATVDRLCRLVLLDLLPAVAEHDLPAFGGALAEIQDRVGQGFASAQGGLYARPDLVGLVNDLQADGLVGVGQSSWGPTIYGFSAAPSTERAAILRRLHARTGWPDGTAFWTTASRHGARLSRS